MATIMSSSRLSCMSRPARSMQRAISTRSPRSRVVRNVRAAMDLDPVATIAAANGLRAALEPTAAVFNSYGLPEWLVHWGHPGNMMVVLLAMGGYGGVYLGWQIRTATDEDVIVKAKELHPKLALGALIFFALGASGGVLSLVMQGKPILESPHAITGFTGLGLLAFQAMLPLFFQEDPGTRTAHAFLGTSIFALLCVHAVLGLNLGLSI